jgi:FKBP-type peptidyl-prolyl cis-trans isomerase FklB
MNFRILTTLTLVLVAGQLWAADKAAKKPELKSLKEKASYGIGLGMGTNLKKDSIELDIDLLTQGIRDGLAGGKTQLSEEEVQQVMEEFQKELMAKQATRAKALGEKNKKEGETFLAGNKKKEGVKITKSGLQYKVLKAGNGKKPSAEDTVTTNYRGTFIDGKEFDSSKKHGGPATFAVNRVIPGWTEALQLMPVGSKWQLFIPSDLAYDEEGFGAEIGPDTTLIFELELVSIDKPGAKPAIGRAGGGKQPIAIPDDEQ